VTVIAILALIGSALLLLMAVLMAFAMFVAPTPDTNDVPLPPMFFKVFKVVLPLFYALPAVWGIVTAVGLLGLRNWARISTIVFSVLLIVFGAFGMLTSMVFFLKPPSGNGLDPKAAFFIGVAMSVFALVQIGIGIWWMVFFNRAEVKAQFLPQPLPFQHSGQGANPYAIDPRYSTLVPPPGLPAAPDVPSAAPTPSGRPLSVSIIAWYLLAGCLFIPFSLFLHSPTALFVTILTGWRATVFFLALAAVHIYAGIALLRMKPAGRLVGMGYFIFTLLNIAVFYLAPGGHARFIRFVNLQQSMFPWMRSAQANSLLYGDMTPFLIIGVIAGFAVSLAPLYFLAAAKPAFDKAAREQAG
jgi:hypothetical protein